METLLGASEPNHRSCYYTRPAAYFGKTLCTADYKLDRKKMHILLLKKTTKTMLCFVRDVGSTECQHAQSHTLRWNPSFTPMCCCRKGRVPDIRWGSRRLSSHYRITWFSSIFGYFMFYLTLWITILINLCFIFYTDGGPKKS